MHVVSFGNAFEGITLYGPFENFDDALEYAEKSGGDWEIVEIEKPN